MRRTAPPVKVIACSSSDMGKPSQTGRNLGIEQPKGCEMSRKPPIQDPDDRGLEVSQPKEDAAGIPGVTAALKQSWDQMGAKRTALTLLKVNQKNGFDCPGCAWPEGDKRHVAEFCENGAKAVAEEATTRRITRAFFEEHPVSELAGRSDYWLGQQGRLTEPMLKRDGSDHYQPGTW